jgi:hypothetical protein
MYLGEGHGSGGDERQSEPTTRRRPGHPAGAAVEETTADLAHAAHRHHGRGRAQAQPVLQQQRDQVDDDGVHTEATKRHRPDQDAEVADPEWLSPLPRVHLPFAGGL